MSKPVAGRLESLAGLRAASVALAGSGVGDDWEALGSVPAEVLDELAMQVDAEGLDAVAHAVEALGATRSLGAALATRLAAESAALAHAAGWPVCAYALATEFTQAGGLRVTDLASQRRSDGARRVRLEGTLHVSGWHTASGALLVPLPGGLLARVAMTSRGVTERPSEDLGLRAAGLRRVRLVGVEVSPHDLASVDCTMLERLRIDRRLSMSRALSAFRRHLLRDTFDYVGGRTFQKSVLATLQVIRHRCADLDGAHRVLSAQLARASLSQGEQAARVALLCLREHVCLVELVRACQQLQGGRGYLMESWVASAFRDVKSLARLLGTQAELRADLLGDMLPRLRSGELSPSYDALDGREPEEASLTQFRARVRETLREVRLDRGFEEASEVVALHRLFAERQLTTASLAPEDGGLGADFRFTVALIEELMTSASASAGVSLMLAAGTVFPLIAEHASPEARAEILPQIARGDAIFAFGITEPTGGSDLVTALRTTARVEGDELVLNGEKKFLTNAPVADYVLALVRTGDAGGPLQTSLVIVPVRTPGVEVSDPYEKLGLDGSPTGAIRFHEVRVPRTNLLGRVGMGLHQLAGAAVHERVLLAAGCLALSLRSLGRALQALPGSAPQVDALLTQLARVAGERALVREVVEGARGEAIDRNSAALLKFSACEAAQEAIEVSADAVGELDDPCLIKELQVALCDSRVFSVFAGASEMMRDTYSAGLLPRIRLGAWGRDD